MSEVCVGGAVVAGIVTAEQLFTLAVPRGDLAQRKGEEEHNHIEEAAD
jgi:hypothetical protein